MGFSSDYTVVYVCPENEDIEIPWCIGVNPASFINLLRFEDTVSKAVEGFTRSENDGLFKFYFHGSLEKFARTSNRIGFHAWQFGRGCFD